MSSLPYTAARLIEPAAPPCFEGARSDSPVSPVTRVCSLHLRVYKQNNAESQSRPVCALT